VQWKQVLLKYLKVLILLLITIKPLNFYHLNHSNFRLYLDRAGGIFFFAHLFYNRKYSQEWKEQKQEGKEDQQI